MPKKIQHTTKANLISVPLPNHGTTYTVISHQFVIDYAYQALANAGFGIVDEEYRCTADGQIAQGIYKLHFNSDPELSMMFAWTNSYNKQVKFKCVVGAYINNSGSVMISGEVGSWVRKHTGTADTEVKDTIDTYISNAYMYYNQLCADKAAMEVVSLNKRKQSQLLGVLFAEYEILTTEQASMIRDQMKRPQQVFKNTDSLWAFYNFVTNALQSSHPKTWMEDQRILHYFIGTICDFSAPVQGLSTPVADINPQDLSELVDPLYANPGQTNILDQIADLEADQMDEDIRYAAAEEEVVQNDPEMLEIAHQVDEILETLDEAEEDVLTEDELAHELYGVDNDIEVSILGPCAAHDVETEKEEDSIVQYTDPAGNTFEAPMVDKTFTEELTEAMDQKFETDAEDLVWGKEVRLDTINLNETTSQAVIVEENLDGAFAEEDDFDLDFNETEEEPDNTPDFF